MQISIPQLKIKHHFYIEINGQYLAYQVDQTQNRGTHRKQEALQIQEDQDLVSTLVTL